MKSLAVSLFVVVILFAIYWLVFGRKRGFLDRTTYYSDRHEDDLVANLRVRTIPNYRLEDDLTSSLIGVSPQLLGIPIRNTKLHYLHVSSDGGASKITIHTSIRFSFPFVKKVGSVLHERFCNRACEQFELTLDSIRTPPPSLDLQKNEVIYLSADKLKVFKPSFQLRSPADVVVGGSMLPLQASIGKKSELTNLIERAQHSTENGLESRYITEIENAEAGSYTLIRIAGRCGTLGSMETRLPETIWWAGHMPGHNVFACGSMKNLLEGSTFGKETKGPPTWFPSRFLAAKEMIFSLIKSDEDSSDVTIPELDSYFLSIFHEGVYRGQPYRAGGFDMLLRVDSVQHYEGCDDKYVFGSPIWVTHLEAGQISGNYVTEDGGKTSPHGYRTWNTNTMSWTGEFGWTQHPYSLPFNTPDFPSREPAKTERPKRSDVPIDYM